jgi:FKBP-type peptidyl-prolyl cis-trans isomerase 2
MAVKQGDKVKIEYTGKFDDGTVFDSSEKHGKPIEFEVGAKQVVPGFENAVLHMEEGEEKSFVLKPSEAYGEVNEQMVQKLPKDKLPADVKEGMVLGMNLPNGGQLPAKVLEVNDDEVMLDLNHPLAGKTLHFEIKVIGITA